MVTPVKRVPIHLQSAQNRLIVKNGTLVNHDEESEVDIYIEDGTVKLIGNHLIIPGGTRSIDATGKYIFPGGIDLNVHLQKPGYGTQTIDDFYQGTKAALAGGTTMVVDTVSPGEGETAKEAFVKWRKWADDKVCCDYGLKMEMVSGLEPDQLEELVTPEVGINTFLLNLGGEHRLKDKPFLDTCQKIGEVGGLAMVNAENGVVVDSWTKELTEEGFKGPEGHALAHTEDAQTEATLRACLFGNAADCPIYINSVMSGAAADIIKRKKERFFPVIGEVTTAGLACDGEAYWNESWAHSAAHVCTPPLRKGEQDSLLSGLVSGSLDLVSSHHAAYNSKQKALGAASFKDIPSGVGGIEERLMVLWTKGVLTGRISRQQFVSLVSTTPAKLINIYPQKGRVEVGSDADLVIWDPEATRTLGKDDQVSKCDFSIYEGLQVTGVPDFVIVRGRLVKDQEIFRPMQGYGMYRELPPFGDTLCDLMQNKKDKQVALPEPVVRKPEHLPQLNGVAEDDIPPPTPEEAEEKPVSADQHKTNFDLNSHPQTPEFDSARSSPARSSVRVRAPPGGVSRGFW